MTYVVTAQEKAAARPGVFTVREISVMPLLRQMSCWTSIPVQGNAVRKSDFNVDGRNDFLISGDTGCRKYQPAIGSTIPPQSNKAPSERDDGCIENLHSLESAGERVPKRPARTLQVEPLKWGSR